MLPCIVCSVETQKYKCPRCMAPYCSLDCYRAHQEIECVRQETSNEALEQSQELEPTVHEPFTTDDTVPPESLLQLRYSEELKQLLYNPHLRNLLREIDVAPNAWKAMRAAMQEPLFLEFADACLQVVEPMTESEHQEQILMN